MPKNETGEFELVLGNRQLLSGFAVVAILFGVFFAMGYIVGRNSTPSARMPAAEGVPGTSAAGQQDPGRAPAPPPAPSSDAGANPAAASDAAAQPATTPASAPSAPETAPAATAEPAGKAARPAEAAKPAESATPRAQPMEALQTGSYLQVIATIQSDAEVISKSLAERRFPNVITPSSIEGRFRVLVGPYRDAASVGGAKTELEKLGFHPILVKVAEKN
jgi:cell division septation protein DedD